VLRRSERTRFPSASDDEVGALQGAIRAERAWRARQSNTDSATRRAEEERADTLSVSERRRSRRAPGRDPRRASLASEAIKKGRPLESVLLFGGPAASDEKAARVIQVAAA
jgi:hypothetical protein